MDINTLQTRFPEKQLLWNQLHDLANRKLWHQLTVLLQEILSQSFMQSFEASLLLHKSALKPIETNISPVKLSNIVVSISKRAPSPASSISFITPYVHILRLYPVSYCFILLNLAHFMIAKQYSSSMESEPLPDDEIVRKSPREIVELVTEVINKESLSASSDNNFLMAEYHHVYSLLYKATDYSKFVNHFLDYLSYVEDVTKDYPNPALAAMDLAIASLCAPTVLNISDILVHPFIDKELSSPEVKGLLKIFNSGDVSGYEYLVQKEKALSVDNRLVSCAEVLSEKVRLLGLMELAFSKPTTMRSVSFDEISTRCLVDINRVELLLIKAMSLDLLRGAIDGVARQVTVDYVRPRALGFDQLETLAQHLLTWADTVEKAVEKATCE
ncbi:hypothetical protein RCL1_000679 [Eukaryota sp. TZLM3-RCL]